METTTTTTTTRVGGSVIVVLLMVLFRLICAAEEAVTVSSSSPICPVVSITDFIARFHNTCTVSDSLSAEENCGGFIGVVEGDEDSLQKAVDLVHMNSQKFVAVLFYASWCPFSKTIRQKFSVLSSMYPSICHMAVEESSVRPRTLGRYRVHGFPTLFLLNSTIRLRYHGSRTIDSFVIFYSAITEIEPASLTLTNLEMTGKQPKSVKFGGPDQESCPFSWAWFPNNVLHQEAYLGLATMFVLLRMIYLFHPMLLACALATWRRHIQNQSLMNLWEHPLAYLNKVLQVFSALKEPCKKRNLQEGALNAGVWASKSLASVSIGDASTS